MSRNDAAVGIKNALLHRARPERFKLTERGRPYRRKTLLQMAASYLRAGGVSTRGRSELEVATESLHSQFGVLLADVARRALRARG
jgi:hypothetical protein